MIQLCVGTIGEFFRLQAWHEKPAMTLSEAVRLLQPWLLGKAAMCVSWDSSTPIFNRDMRYVGHRSDNPRWTFECVAQHDIDTWPESEDGFDEWHFFSGSLPTRVPDSICNVLGLELQELQAKHRDVLGFDPIQQMRSLGTRFVIGVGDSFFALSTSSEAVALLENEMRPRVPT